MRGTSHPGVVKLHSFIESSDHYFLILERQCNFADGYPIDYI